MRTRRVKPSVEAFDEASALIRPLIQVLKEKWWIPVCKPLAPLMARRGYGAPASEVFGNGVQKILDERPKLRICGGPVSAHMRFYALVKMAFRDQEGIVVK